MKKKLLSMILALAMIVTICVGCGGDTEKSTSAPSAQTADPVPETQVSDVPEPDSEQETGSTAMEEAVQIPYSEPLSYPLADGDVTFTILHPEPMLGPLSG